MKSVISPQLGGDHTKLMQRRNDATTQIRTHGTKRIPAAARGVVAQSAQGGALLTWHLPTRYDDVTGYRIYVGTEKNLAIQIRDRGTRQVLVPLAAAASTATVKSTPIFVSVVNGYREGPRKQVNAASLPTSATQVIPPPPTTFLDMFSGGLDKTQGGPPTGKKTP